MKFVIRHSSFVIRSRAFTLMEVLIAVAAFAIVLAAINAVFYGALRLRNKTTEAIEQSLPLEQALAIIKRDLANIVVPGGTLFGAFQSGVATNTMFGQASPSFYTTTGVIDETSPWAEVQRVAYSLVDSTNRAAGRDLVRSVSRNLMPALQDQPVQQWLLSGVEDLAFQMYDGTQWRPTWDSTTTDLASGQTNTLPQAVKVQLLLAPEEKGRALPPVELLVPIVVQARTNQTQQAEGGGQ
jgi:general secretion pathway protein J